MGVFRDLTGEKFGILTVIEPIDFVNKHRKKYFKVRCECGKEKNVPGTRLIHGKMKSCGCEKPWKRKAKGIAGRNTVLSSYKLKALRRGYAFSITDEQVFELFEYPCFYCGVMKYNRSLPSDPHAAYEYNGIDRIDNTKGYIEGNVVACCGRCNRAKDVMSINEFESWIESLYTTLQQRRRLL